MHIPGSAFAVSCSDFQALFCHTQLKTHAGSATSHMHMQGWTVFQLVSKMRLEICGWSPFHGSFFEVLLHRYTMLSYSDAEVGACVAHDVSHLDMLHLVHVYSLLYQAESRHW